MKKQEPSPAQYLALKDLIFAKERIIQIHNKIEAKNTKMMASLDWVDAIFDLDMYESLARFLNRFAKAHPFEDGNKRTAFVTTDSFLRLNRLKLDIKAEKKTTTEDEKFFWQNANNQKSAEQTKQFLKEHIVPARKPTSVEQAIEQSIQENSQLLENLAAE
ncbi:MAG TPA: Fic family protein [Candidatus Diapherotrites archaeon]|uniref:Fic family protein n=1 Tax=Candidatus Iainarchaeum sp. TaxID=3101447 RepID=A0A7J4IYZ2_9ARCH|nr:Fic family protein [Candidatus Diapherotrites archaeon]